MGEVLACGVPGGCSEPVTALILARASDQLMADPRLRVWESHLRCTQHDDLTLSAIRSTDPQGQTIRVQLYDLNGERATIPPVASLTALLADTAHL